MSDFSISSKFQYSTAFIRMGEIAVPRSGKKVDPVTGNEKPKEDPKNNGSTSKSGSKELTPEQQAQVKKLQESDKRVKAHEQAHLAAGGNLVRGGPSYQYTKGPDGIQYAVGGEVSIDTSIDPKKPQESINKMEQVRRAALAPADPSAQDLSVASDASKKMAELSSQIADSTKTSSATNGKSTEKTDKSSPNANSNPIFQKAMKAYSKAQA